MDLNIPSYAEGWTSRLCLQLGFGGEGKGRKGLWRGKLLFGSFKKIGKGFGGF